MKKSAWSTAVVIALSLVLTGCGLSTHGVTNSVSRSAEGNPPHPTTGNRTVSVSTGTGNRTKAGSGDGPGQAGSKPTKTPVGGGTSSGQTQPTGTTLVSFSALHAGVLTAVWFGTSGVSSGASSGASPGPSTNSVTANTAGTLSSGASATSGGGQIGYVTDSHHIYRTADGGKTWRPVATVSGSLVGVTSDSTTSAGRLIAAWTSSQLWLSTDGIHFAKVNIQLPAGGLTQVSVAGNAVWMLDGGTIYRYINGALQTISGGIGGAVGTGGSVGTVTAITAVTPNTCYAVAATTAVYETTDGGGTWRQLFWPPLNGQLPWQTQIDVSGSHIAVLYANGDSGVNQSAYIGVESNDGGKTWVPLFDNPSFASDYGHPTPIVQQNLGNTALLFALLPTGDVVFVGDATAAPVWSVLTPQGTVENTFAMKAGGPVTWPTLATAAISAPGGAQIVLAGGAGSSGVIDMTPSLGSTWDSLS